MDRGFPEVDFRNVVFNVWKEVLHTPPTKRQYEIAQYIERGPDPSKSPWEYPNNLIFINAFRGIGKSWLTSAFCPHALDQWRDLNILVVSASKPRADEFSVFTKRLINDMPWWSHMIPSEGQRDANIAFDVAGAPPGHAPSVKSTGITGQITGGRADIAILDDIESLNNSMTILAREQLMWRQKEIISAVLKPGGRVIVLGTQQSDESIYRQMAGQGFQTRIWPVRAPDSDWMVKNGSNLAPAIAAELEAGELVPGDPTDPDRFNELDLQAREARYGRSGFALQFMLDTGLADHLKYPLKLSDLIVADITPQGAFERYVWGRGPSTLLDLPNPGLEGDRFYGPMQTLGAVQPFQGVAMFIDPSGRGKDETGFSIVGHLNGTLYLLSNGGYRAGYTESTLEALCREAKLWGVQRYIHEDNFGDGMFGALLAPVARRIHPGTIESVRSTGQKERRVLETLEPIIQQHRLVVNRSVVERDALIEGDMHSEQEELSYKLFHQMTHLSAERGCLLHDDRLESVAGACAHYAMILKQDEDETYLERNRERADAQLEAWSASFDRQRGPKGPTEGFEREWHDSEQW